VKNQLTIGSSKSKIPTLFIKSAIKKVLLVNLENGFPIPDWYWEHRKTTLTRAMDFNVALPGPFNLQFWLSFCLRVLASLRIEQNIREFPPLCIQP
jgi:hypothetical protein